MALTDDLVSYYEFDADGGDSHGANDVVEAGNGGDFVSGHIGNAFQPASGGYLQDTSPSNIDLTGAGGGTLMAWFNRSGAPGINEGLFGKASSGVGRDFFLLCPSANNRIRFHCVNSDSSDTVNLEETGAALANDGTWYLVFAWFDPSSNLCKLQLNNGTIRSDTLTGTPRNTSTTLMISADNNHSFLGAWTGQIDDLAFWRRVLTDEERDWLYNSGAGRTYAEVVAGMETGPVGAKIIFRNREYV